MILKNKELMLELKNNLAYSVITGLPLYGFGKSNDKINVKSVFFYDKIAYFGMLKYETTYQYSDEYQKRNYFEFKNFISLLTTGNPVLLEMLFINDIKFLLKSSPFFNEILQNKNDFISMETIDRYIVISKKYYDKTKSFTTADIKNCKVGYNIENAFSSLRLLYQCFELITTNIFEIDCSKNERLISLMNGDLAYEDVITTYNNLLNSIADARKITSVTDFPKQVDEKQINELCAYVLEDYLTTCENFE